MHRLKYTNIYYLNIEILALTIELWLLIMWCNIMKQSEHLVRIWLDLVSVIYHYFPKYASKVVDGNNGTCLNIVGFYNWK